MLRQFVGRKDIFLLGTLMGGINAVGIKDVDHQSAVDLHRLGLIFGIEKESAAKTTDARLSRLMQNRVGPEGHDALGRHQFVVVLPWEPHFVEVQRCAAISDQSCAKEEHEHGPRLDSLSDHRLGSFHELGV
ncbi:MAG: hypothetical protein ACYC4U_22340 [Pirellulaceae bacterium]